MTLEEQIARACEAGEQAVEAIGEEASLAQIAIAINSIISHFSEGAEHDEQIFALAKKTLKRHRDDVAAGFGNPN